MRPFTFLSTHCALAACLACLLVGSQAGAQLQPKRGGELAYGELPPLLGNLNPYAVLSRNGPTDRVYSMLYEPLFRFNFNTDEWENVLATGLTEVRPERGKSAVEVSLKQALWHDGKPFTAADVAFTYDYIRTVAVNKTQREMVASQIVDVRQSGPSTVRFEFRDSVPDARFLLLDFIIPASKFSPAPSFTPAPGVPTLDQHPIGTGPYKFDAFATGYPVMSLNDRYHGDRGNIATMRSRGFSDPITMVQTLLTVGGINLIVELPFEHLALIERNGGSTVKQVASYNVYSVAMRQNSQSILRSEKVRRALTMAVNRSEILKTWFGGRGRVLASPVAPRAPGYDASVTELPYDLEQARRDISAERAGNQRLTFIYPTSESGSDTKVANIVHSITEALQAAGVKVEEKPLSSRQYDQSLLEKGDFDLAFVRWEFNPAYDITPFFRSENRKSGGHNFMNFSDSQMDQLANEYQVATDPARRLSILRSMQRLLNQQAPAIWLVNEEKSYAYNNRYRIPTVDPFHFFTYVNQWWLSTATGR